MLLLITILLIGYVLYLRYQCQALVVKYNELAKILVDVGLAEYVDDNNDDDDIDNEEGRY